MHHASLSASLTGDLVLYTSRYCGFCYRVLFTVKQLELSPENIQLVDVTRAPERRQDIVRATGRRTVPVLCIRPETGASPESAGETWLFESRNIVRYLNRRFDD